LRAEGETISKLNMDGLGYESHGEELLKVCNCFGAPNAGRAQDSLWFIGIRSPTLSILILNRAAPKTGPLK